MDYRELMTKYFSKALESEYGIESSERLGFKSINKNSLYAYLDGYLIFNVMYSVVEYSTTTVFVNIKTQNYNKIALSICSIEIDKDIRYSEAIEKNFVEILRDIDLDINKKTNVINNAQEIIEITEKAKEENIKKDIETIETKILERAKDGDESVMFRTLEFKTNFAIMNKSDNEIVKHFRNKGFECVIDSYPSGSGLLKIKWGD